MPTSSLTASYRASAFRQVIGPVAGALGATLVLSVLIVVGSRNLAHFDAALVGYTFAVLFATFGITYRYAMWLQRPPTALYWRRGWQAFFRRGLATAQRRHWVRRVGSTCSPTASSSRADRLRGLTHMLIMWGCLLAVAITFPLVFGWIHFRPVPGDLSLYEAVVFGFPAFRFPHDSVVGVPPLPRPGVVVVPGHRRRDAGDAAAHARPRRGGRAAVRGGLPAADPAVRHQRHRADADGELHLDEGLRLRRSSRSCTRSR